MTCPTCNGQKIIHGIFPPVSITCQTCQGSSVVDDDYPNRLVAGQQLRRTRLASGLSLREYCFQAKEDPVLRSRLERGLR